MEWRWGRLWCIFNWRSFEETQRALQFNYAPLFGQRRGSCKLLLSSCSLPVASCWLQVVSYQLAVATPSTYVSDCMGHKRRSQRFWAKLPLCVQIWIVEMLGIKMENREPHNCWAILGYTWNKKGIFNLILPWPFNLKITYFRLSLGPAISHRLCFRKY